MTSHKTRYVNLDYGKHEISATKPRNSWPTKVIGTTKKSFVVFLPFVSFAPSVAKTSCASWPSGWRAVL